MSSQNSVRLMLVAFSIDVLFDVLVFFDLLGLKKLNGNDDPLVLVLFLQMFRWSVKDIMITKTLMKMISNRYIIKPPIGEI